MASKDDKPTDDTAKEKTTPSPEEKAETTVTGKAPPPPTIELTAKEVTPNSKDGTEEKADTKPAKGAAAEATPPAGRTRKTSDKQAAPKRTDKPPRTAASDARPKAKADTGSAAATDGPPAQKPTAAPPPAPAASGGSGFGIGLAAIAGGVIGAGVLYALMAGQVLPLPGGPSNDVSASLAAVETRVDALSSQVQQTQDLARATDLEALRTELAAQAVSTEDVVALRAELDGITAALADLPVSEAEGAVVALNADVAALTQRLGELEAGQAETASSVAALGARGESDAPAVDLSGIESRLAALEGSAVTPPTIDTSRIDAVEESLAALGAQNDAIAAITARLETASGELGETVAATAATAEASVTDLSGRIDAAVAGVGERLDAAEAALSTLQDEVATLAARDHAIDDERRAAMVSAIAGLERSAQGSGPFARELAAVRAIAGDTEAVAALEPFAADGVPSVRVLATRFSELAGPIIDAGARAEADTVLSRLAANAQTLVRVRPTGFVAGDSDAAAVARIESLLGEGKVEAAIAEWDKLSEAGRSASANWAAEARQRIALETALAGLAAMPAQ